MKAAWWERWLWVGIGVGTVFLFVWVLSGCDQGGHYVECSSTGSSTVCIEHFPDGNSRHME